MKALLFEWLTGGGLWLDSTPLDPAGPMLRQGSAMVSAVGLDLAKFAEVDLLIDSRLDQPKAPVSSAIVETAATLNGLTQLAQVHSIDSDAALKNKLQSLAADADAILLIAPETDDCLADSIRWLGPAQHKLISPSLDFVVATSNKNQLAERLTQQGFDALPQGTDLASFLKLPSQQQATWLPLVVKPSDGAGSEGVEYFATVAELDTWLTQNSAIQQADFRIERFVSGTPASIAVVCQPGSEPVFFSAMKQVLRPQPIGEYLRSEDCLSESQKLRAKNLAARAIDCLPETTGFFGLDIVLSEQNDQLPANDVLIEINPRVTMSYLELRRQFGDGQIAQMMLGRLVKPQ